LVLHGDADQIVPFADSALLSSKLFGAAKLEIFLGASLKLDKLSEVCFSGLNYSDFFQLPPPGTRREYE